MIHLDTQVFGTLGGMTFSALTDRGNGAAAIAVILLTLVVFGIFMWHHAARWRIASRLVLNRPPE